MRLSRHRAEARSIEDAKRWSNAERYRQDVERRILDVFARHGCKKTEDLLFHAVAVDELSQLFAQVCSEIAAMPDVEALDLRAEFETISADLSSGFSIESNATH